MGDYDLYIALDIAKNSGMSIFNTKTEIQEVKEFVFNDLYVYFKKLIKNKRVLLLFYNDLGGFNHMTTRKLALYKGKLISLCQEHSKNYDYLFLNEVEVFFYIFESAYKREEKKIVAKKYLLRYFPKNGLLKSDGAESFVLLKYFLNIIKNNERKKEISKKILINKKRD